MKAKSLGEAVTETLLSEPATELAAEYAELGLDAVLSEGVLKDIPFVSSALAIAKLGLSISDRLLIGKLLTFLANLSAIEPEKRRDMIRRLESDPTFHRKVGAHILELLSRIEGKEKAQMVAKVFTAYSAEKIDAKTLLRLNFAIERLPGSEIPSVRPFHNRSKQRPFVFDAYTGQALANAGLAKIDAGIGGVSFESTDLCRTFLELDLDRTST